MYMPGHALLMDMPGHALLMDMPGRALLMDMPGRSLLIPLHMLDYKLFTHIGIHLENEKKCEMDEGVEDISTSKHLFDHLISICKQ